MDNAVDLDPKDYVTTLDLLRKLDFLQGVPDAELRGVLFSLQTQEFPPQKTILFQGEIANRLFIIRKGSVLISTKIKGQKVQLAELKSETYFGEISLLSPTSATATVTAGDQGADVIILSHEFMSHISRKIPDIKQRIQTVIDSRVASKKKAKEQEEEPAA